MGSSPSDILSHYRSLIWPVIERNLTNPKFPKQFAVPEKYKSESDFHWTLTSEYPKRLGKYIRPTLICLTAQAMGVPIEKTLITAAAMQLSEEWILIHDDIEDNSELRRGKSTLHKLYNPELAINAGDALHVLMWKILNDQANPKILEEFFIMLSRTTLGQTVEIKWINDQIVDFTDDDFYFIAASKTGYYTVAGPVRLGGILAGANPEQLDKLTELGYNLGLCFQIIDDVLDVTGDFSGLKHFANDIYESKRTLLLSHLLRSVSQSEKNTIIEILNKPRAEKTQSEVHWVVEKMKTYGSIEYAKTKAKSFRDQAYNIIKDDLDFLSVGTYREDLETLANFILNRDH